jgi:peptidyl-prolyl cis-trans isomerase SurA
MSHAPRPGRCAALLQRPRAQALRRPCWRRTAAALAAGALLAVTTAAQAQGRLPQRNGDWIAAVVNTELVTAGEVDRRLERVLEQARRNGQSLPDSERLRAEVLDALITERAIITTAREVGMRVDGGDIDRAVQNIALQNQLSLPELRRRLDAEGIDYLRFRENLRDQLMLERMREREVYRRIVVTDEEVDRLIEQQRAAAGVELQLNLAQILVTVPDNASEAVLAARRARILEAAARVRGGEAFEAVAREISEDGNRERGGEMGLRPVSRFPDLFIEATRRLAVGAVTAEPLRSGAGFHLLKVLDRQEGDTFTEVQTRSRHILLRTSPQLPAEVAARRLAEYRRQIEGGRSFAELAREISEDGSAANGGELPWAGPGTMVPEFEEAMNALPPGALSQPVVSRFGVHLIQVLERREVPIERAALREQARNVLREQKFDQAYEDWTRELRLRAYVELREPPL